MKIRAIVAVVGGVAAGFATAGPDKVTFPNDYLKGTLYATVDRVDIKQYRELYASPGVLEAVRAGFECHRPHEKMNFVISMYKLAGKFPDASAVKKAPKGDVQIVGFQFMPAKITAAVGKPLKFLNVDDSPHFIVVQGGPKADVVLRGQTTSLTFDKAGGYNYICGLHPSMKGTIEVK